MANPFLVSTGAPIVPPTTALAPPIRRQGNDFAWTLERIRRARDAQLRGIFWEPVRMAEEFRTNDALFTAYTTRVSTQSAVRLLWRPVDSKPGRATAKRIEASIDMPTHVRESILGTLANHGIAVGYVNRETVDDPKYGPTIRMCLTEWPLEHVRYNLSTCLLETRTLNNGTVSIVHGDGRWIIFRKFGVVPWTQDAAVLPAAFLWFAHTSGVNDWANASLSHGQTKVLGTPREGVPFQLDDNTGRLSAEVDTLLRTITELASGDASAGVIPAGSTATLLTNGSTAWQVFKELILNREKAAMRIYLGTDAILGAQGGAPGVDISSLFSVASTRIQGDFEALERGYREGMIVPWAQLHGVRPDYIGTCEYAMPDTDGEQRAAQEGTAIDRLGAALKVMKDSGLIVSQDTLDALVDVLGVSVPCTLASEETRVVPLPLAPADIAKVVRVREARASNGLGLLGDERDDLTISELDANAKAAAAPAPTPAPDAPAGGAPPPANPNAPPAEEGASTHVPTVAEVADEIERRHLGQA